MLLCALAWVSEAALVHAQTPAEPNTAIAGIDADVERAMKELHVPGAAIGVIEDGKVVLAKGYGVREIGKPGMVDADTLFDIGSMTKSFTAVTVAAMVDDGKLKWDVPVVQYIPWFRLYDPVATELITPRDLLTHRSGLPRHDFIRMSTYLTREELMHRLRYLEPSRSFRDVFQYNNLTYTAAGYLAGQVNGSTWEELVKQRIFLPLGMTHSSTSAVDLQRSSNFAHPHSYEDGKIVTVPIYDYQKFGVGPNGAVNSSVNDMLKYLEFHLDGGTAGGKQVISAAQMKELHAPVTVLEPNMAAATGAYAYALGWMTGSYHGHSFLEHGGSINGFTSDMILFPDSRIGIVVLNNRGTALPQIITKDLRDRLLGVNSHDYLADNLAAQAKFEHQVSDEKKAMEAGRIPDAKATLPLSKYAGTYFHPAYGKIHVIQDGNNLTVKFDAIDLTLQHYNYDTFLYDDTDIAQFHIGDSGKVTEMLLPLEPAVKPFVFTRQDE